MIARRSPDRVSWWTRLHARLFPTRARVQLLADEVETLTATVGRLRTRVNGCAERGAMTDARLDSVEIAADELIGSYGQLSERVECDTTNINTLARQMNDLRVQLEDLRSQTQH